MAKMGFFNKRNDVANNDIIKHVFIDDTEKYLWKIATFKENVLNH